MAHVGRNTHPENTTRTFRIWYGLFTRCYNKNTPLYRRYGAKGITVCDRWQSFDNFKVDMGEAPDQHSLDRIDNSKGYEPGNCRWATQEQQMANTRTAKFITFQGETLTINAWARKLNRARSVIRSRLKKSWPLERVLVGKRPCIKRVNLKARKTHCKRGHEFTAENTYIRPNKEGKDCRACRRQQFLNKEGNP